MRDAVAGRLLCPFSHRQAGRRAGESTHAPFPLVRPAAAAALTLLWLVAQASCRWRKGRGRDDGDGSRDTGISGSGRRRRRRPTPRLSQRSLQTLQPQPQS